MLKIKDNIPIEKVEEYGFTKHWNRPYVLLDGVVKIWVDKNKLLHFNNPRLEQLDLIHKMHDILEVVDTKTNLKMLSKPALLEENKKLKEKIKQLERHIEIIELEKNLNLDMVEKVDE